MYLIELERCWKDKTKQTVVRLFDTASPFGWHPLAETIYWGDPPGLTLLDEFAAIRMPKPVPALPEQP